jgi:hypothetical protein
MSLEGFIAAWFGILVMLGLVYLDGRGRKSGPGNPKEPE